MAQATSEKIVRIPIEVFESADSKEELEDWLLAHDPTFINEMRRLKADADSDKGRPLHHVAKK